MKFSDIENPKTRVKTVFFTNDEYQTIFFLLNYANEQMNINDLIEIIEEDFRATLKFEIEYFLLKRGDSDKHFLLSTNSFFVKNNFSQAVGLLFNGMVSMMNDFNKNLFYQEIVNSKIKRCFSINSGIEKFYLEKGVDIPETIRQVMKI